MLAIGVAVVLIAAATYFVAPQVMSLFGGDTVDTSNLPNARLVEEGTPVSRIAAGRATPALPSAPGAQPTAASAAPDQPVPEPTPASASPPQSDQAPAASQSVANPAQPAVAPTTAAVGSPLFDEKFVSNDAHWPSDPQGAAQLTNDVYRLVTRQAGQFVAIGAPMANVPSDVVVDATFRKLGGPPGGGYGIIVRNQDATNLDGANQNGHYYVMEAGDKGEVGMWRRDGDHWVDLLPWQHSDAVKPGTATNELSVRAVGNTLTLIVNGSIVAARTDATFPSGTAGLFAGGDGNQVAVSHFSIQNP